jgi:polar amino acid transport system ATP-binding protein
MPCAGVDLAVEEHEVICLIGASGSGKSTLLRCINLLERIDHGRIMVRGTEVTARGVDVNRVRRGIGIVFQSFNLFPHMSVMSNVTLAPRKVMGLNKSQAEQEAIELLDRFGLADKARRVSGQDSREASGSASRSMRALATNPS